MRRILLLLGSFGSAGALENARAELQLSHARSVQAALVARRIGTRDAVAAHQSAVVAAVPSAA